MTRVLCGEGAHTWKRFRRSGCRAPRGWWETWDSQGTWEQLLHLLRVKGHRPRWNMALWSLVVFVQEHVLRFLFPLKKGLCTTQTGFCGVHKFSVCVDFLRECRACPLEESFIPYARVAFVVLNLSQSAEMAEGTLHSCLEAWQSAENV